MKPATLTLLELDYLGACPKALNMLLEALKASKQRKTTRFSARWAYNVIEDRNKLSYTSWFLFYMKGRYSIEILRDLNKFKELGKLFIGCSYEIIEYQLQEDPSKLFNHPLFQLLPKESGR